MCVVGVFDSGVVVVFVVVAPSGMLYLFYYMSLLLFVLWLSCLFPAIVLIYCCCGCD